jgi:hypothetical protein
MGELAIGLREGLADRYAVEREGKLPRFQKLVEGTA